MAETPSSEAVSTKLERIAQLARRMRGVALTTLSHHIDIDWMREAHRRTRKDGATGIDGQTAAEYAVNLESNLRALLDRAKDGDAYRAAAVRRVHIPKGDGAKTRPIGIPTFEDKVLQRAVAMMLEAVYEQDFLDCSYGFRPGRSAHDALQVLWEQLTEMGGGWVYEADIESFYDCVDHTKLREVLSHRIRDGVLIRLIGKWLNAGVMEQGQVYHPETGTPQGAVISPILSNIFLHEVLDEWFEQQVKPRLAGRAKLIRFADDFVMVFETQEDAQRVADVLAKRFDKYGLRQHPTKTRLFEFKRPGPGAPQEGSREPGSFDLLGFTHFWGRSRKGKPLVRRKTAKARFSRTLHRINEWCRNNRHLPVSEQHKQLSIKLRGHDSYYGITGNGRALEALRYRVEWLWYKWLKRRSWKSRWTWKRMLRLLEVFPLPPPRVLHSVYVT